MNEIPNINPFVRQYVHESSPWYYAFGIVLILLGVLALSSTIGVTFASILFFGWLLVLGGLVEGIHAFWSKSASEFFLNLLAGVFGVVAGGLMILYPGVSALSITLLLGSFFIVEGIFKTIVAFIYHQPYWGWLVLNGIVTFLLGFLILAQWPSSSLWVIGLFIGVDMIVTGWSLIWIAHLAKKAVAVKR